MSVQPFICGTGRPGREPGKVTIYRYVCPWCAGTGEWTSGERCMECGGLGATNSPKPGIDLSRPYPDGVEPTEVDPQPMPRPPAVMRRPCVDCAYRPGSPEEETRPGPDVPFWCHHGLHRVDGEAGAGYVPTATVGAMPLGAFLCAGWWALATGEQLPDEAFRDPGGADRRTDTPVDAQPNG